MSKHLLRLAGSILLTLLVSCATSTNDSKVEEAHLQMYHNGKILDKYKSDRINRECLVLRGGRAVFKGDIDYAEAEYSSAEKIDLRGRSLIYTDINGPADFNQDIESQVVEIPLYEKANYALIYTDEQGSHTLEQIVKGGSTQYKKPGPTPEEIAEQKAKEEEAKIAAAKAEEEKRLADKKAAALAATAAGTAVKGAGSTTDVAKTAADKTKTASGKSEAELAAEANEKAKVEDDAEVATEASKASLLESNIARNVIVINCKSQVPDDAQLKDKKLKLSAKLMVRKGKETPENVISTREVRNFSNESEYTVEYHHKQALKKFSYKMKLELTESGNDKIIYSSTVPLSCTENGKLDQDFVDVVLEKNP